MKNIFYILFFSLTIISCEQNSSEAENIVNKLLVDMNSLDNPFSKSTVSQNFDLLLNKVPTASTEKWKLSSEKRENGNIIVTSSSRSTNVMGIERDMLQKFEVKNNKIINSEYFFVPQYDFEIVLNDWDTMWDLEKIKAYENVEENVKITSRSPAIRSYANSLEGNFKIENNSNYDIKNLNIMIEHFQRDGTQIKTDNSSITGILRKNGKQKVIWFTTNCESCDKFKLKIIFKNKNETNE
jgi:hypothetical protein